MEIIFQIFQNPPQAAAARAAETAPDQSPSPIYENKLDSFIKACRQVMVNSGDNYKKGIMNNGGPPPADQFIIF